MLNGFELIRTIRGMCRPVRQSQSRSATFYIETQDRHSEHFLWFTGGHNSETTLLKAYVHIAFLLYFGVDLSSVDLPCFFPSLCVFLTPTMSLVCIPTLLDVGLFATYLIGSLLSNFVGLRLEYICGNYSDNWLNTVSVRMGTHYPHVTWPHVMLRVQLGCERRNIRVL